MHKELLHMYVPLLKQRQIVISGPPKTLKSLPGAQARTRTYKDSDSTTWIFRVTLTLCNVFNENSWLNILKRELYFVLL